MKESDAVIINELVLAEHGRRADIALANGKLHAFEIKSDADTLSRLDGQIDAYTRCFDKVTLVATDKHLDQALPFLPDHVEVLQASQLSGSVAFKLIKRGKLDLVTDKSSLAQFLPVSFISKALRANRFACHKGMSRSEALDLWDRLPLSVVRDFTLSFLKARYAGTFKKFLANRANVSDGGQIELLSNWIEQKSASESNLSRSGRTEVRLKVPSRLGSGRRDLYVAPRPEVLKKIMRSE